jgi:hypothetical protein
VSSRQPHLSILGITRRCINRGNLIIEHATRQVLGETYFTQEFDAHQPLTAFDVASINESRALVLPGATLLQPGDHPAMECLPFVTVPILGLGVALRSAAHVSRLELAMQISTTIGSRDPFTHQSLIAAGRASRLVGCQTLLLGRGESWIRQNGPIVVSLGLGCQPQLELCVAACAAMGPTIQLLHAPDAQPARSRSTDLRVLPLESATQAFDLIRTASVVVTGRIHAYLTSLVLGVPAIFLGGWYDSRYTLLEELGVPIEPPVPRRILNLVEAVSAGTYPPEICLANADRLRNAMRSFLDDFAAPLGIEPGWRTMAVPGLKVSGGSA